MKAVYLHTAGAVVVTFVLAACVSNAASLVPQTIEPEPVIAQSQPLEAAPEPAPPPPPPLPVVSEPRFENYLDAPQTAGDWVYQDAFDGSTATFTTGQGFELIIWCDKNTKAVGIDRSTRSQAAGERKLEIKTETASGQFPMVPVRSMSVTAQFSPQNSILDAMAITKGRFAVAVEGERTLYLPAWAEVTRVIEDCR